MADNIIKLTDERGARRGGARVASHAGATAGAIFERRDPRDSCDATADRRGALDDL